MSAQEHYSQFDGSFLYLDLFNLRWGNGVIIATITLGNVKLLKETFLFCVSAITRRGPACGTALQWGERSACSVLGSAHHSRGLMAFVVKILADTGRRRPFFRRTKGIGDRLSKPMTSGLNREKYRWLCGLHRQFIAVSDIDRFGMVVHGHVTDRQKPVMAMSQCGYLRALLTILGFFSRCNLFYEFIDRSELKAMRTMLSRLFLLGERAGAVFLSFRGSRFPFHRAVCGLIPFFAAPMQPDRCLSICLIASCVGIG